MYMDVLIATIKPPTIIPNKLLLIVGVACFRSDGTS